MPKVSAGLLMYKLENEDLYVFLAHPGGPYFKNKDEGHWTIPKGLTEDDEDLLEAAIREFEEETGIKPKGDYVPLDSVKYKNGKILHAWAFKGDFPAGQQIKSNTFEIEWPPRSGQRQSFPEIDRAAFFDLVEAKRKVHPTQLPFIERLEAYLSKTTL